MIGMAIMSVGVMLFAFIGGQGRVLFALVLMAAAGAGLSTHYVMPHSILPDAELEPITLLGIRFLCGPVPVVFYIAGIAVLAAYPITRAYYKKMLEEKAIPPTRIRKPAES